MSSSKLSILALYKYKPDLFDDIILPASLDMNIVKNSILLRSAEFEVLYPDYDFLKDAINLWFTKMYNTFDKWVSALELEYNPLENYDRKEEFTDESRNSNTSNFTGSSSNNSDGTQTNLGTISDSGTTTITSTDTGTTSNTNSVENKKSAFDSSSYQPDSKSDTTGSGSSSNTLNETDTNSNTRTLNTQTSDEMNNSTTASSESNESGTAASSHTGRIHGNIGVTTNQQMIESEITLRRNNNLYELITDLFCAEFCIMVY